MFNVYYCIINRNIMTAIEFNSELVMASKALRPFAIRLTKDADDADDLIQDTMLKAVMNRTKFQDGTNLRAWLYTIMKNIFITNYQKMVRKNTFIDTTENLSLLNSVSSSTDNRAMGDFAMKDITTALEKLHENYRVPFMMFFKGLKYEEIAVMANIPIGTVKNRIFIARKELKDMLFMYAY